MHRWRIGCFSHGLLSELSYFWGLTGGLDVGLDVMARAANGLPPGLGYISFVLLGSRFLCFVR